MKDVYEYLNSECVVYKMSLYAAALVIPKQKLRFPGHQISWVIE